MDFAEEACKVKCFVTAVLVFKLDDRFDGVVGRCLMLNVDGEWQGGQGDKRDGEPDGGADEFFQ